MAVCGMSVAAVSINAQSVYQWKGGSDLTVTNWGTTANWATGSGLTAGPGPTNGTFFARLNVNNATLSQLSYSAAQGFTVYSNNSSNARGLVIGSGTSGSGTFNIVGGTFSTVGSSGQDIAGNSSGNTGRLNISGGNYICSASGIALGIGGGPHCFLTVNSGSAQLTTLAMNSSDSTVDLNGGSLTYRTLSVAGSGKYTNNFNGGTLVAGTNNAAFMSALTVANVRNGGAKIDTAGYNITIAQSLLHSTISGDAASDGGLTKNGNGTLTLTGGNTYTGPTVVNQGTLVELLPQTSSGLTLASGATFTPAVTNSPWYMATTAMTNATLGFNYGSWSINSYTDAVYFVTNLAVSGSITCNISGTGFPVTNLTLLTYVSKTGGGNFVLGSLPPGAAANLLDTGSNLVLQITAASIQNLVWSGGDGIWQRNGGLDWNNSTAQYLEYPSGVNDAVTFNDSSAGMVTIAGQVNPSATTVDVTGSYYTFSGSGSIGGTNGIVKLGTSTLTLYNSNNFTGPVTLSGGSGTSGGTLYVANPSALGATNGTVTVNGPANTLEIGTPWEVGIGVSNKTVILNGTGVGGVLGALRGAAVASGDNVWAGPVVIGSNNARIGVEDNGNLTVSGNITDNGLGYAVLFRSGVNGIVTIAGTNNTWSGATIAYGSASASTVRLGVNNSLPAGSVLNIGNCAFDLNGFNQTSAGLGVASGAVAATSVLTDSGAAATFTVNSTNGSSSFAGDITGNLSLVKTGTNSLTLSGANLTYSGSTAVNQGRLNLSTANSLSTSITVAGGATLSTEATTTGTLTLNANSILLIDASTPGALTTSSVDATAAPINIGFSTPPAPGVDVLVLTAAGGISGNVGNFRVLGARGGSFYLANGNTELHYIASASAVTVTWKGTEPANPTLWDVATTTNWSNGGHPDMFYIGDVVLFDDTASTNMVVVQSGGVVPGSVTFNNSTLAYSVSGASIGGTTLTKTGSGQVTLANANSYSGDTVVNNGILTVQNNSALGSAAATAFVTNSGTLDLGGALAANALNLGTKQLIISGSGFSGNGALINASSNTQINAVQRLSLADNASIGGPGVTVAAGVLTSGGAGRWDMRGTGNTLDLGGFNLTKNGSNYVALVGTTVNNPGNITINGGAFGVQTSTTLGGSSANTVTVNSNSVLELFQLANSSYWSLVLNTNSTVWAESGSGAQNTWAGPVSLNGPATLQADGVLTLSGEVSGAGPFTKTGGSTATLSGNNTYSGGTVISNGVVVAASDSALGTGTVTLNPSATRLVLGDGLTISNTIVINGGGATSRGLIENSGTGGNATLSGGTITLNANVAAGGTFASVNGTLTVWNPINAVSNVSVRTGTVILGGGGAYTNFIINDGTARLGANNGLSTLAMADLGPTTPATPTLDLAGFNQSLVGIQRTAGSASTSRIINSSTSSDSILTLTGTSSYPGVIADAGVDNSRIALAVRGGNLTLSGANTYSGGTTVTNGTLRINTTSAAGTGPLLVQNGGTLTGNGTIAGNATLEAGSTLAPGNGGVGTLAFSGDLTLAGNLQVEIDKSLAQSNDLANVTGALSHLGAGILTVTNIGTNALVAGDYFQVFNKPVTGGETFTIAGPAGVTFTNNLAVDGSISVLTVAPVTGPQLNLAKLGGGQLQFSWTGGGILQAQTNALSKGLGTNWVDYPGTSPITVTIDPANGAVFFRVKQ